MWLLSDVRNIGLCWGGCKLMQSKTHLDNQLECCFVFFLIQIQMFGVYHVSDIVSYSHRAKSKAFLLILLNMLNSLLFWKILAKNWLYKLFRNSLAYFIQVILVHISLLDFRFMWRHQYCHVKLFILNFNLCLT